MRKLLLLTSLMFISSCAYFKSIGVSDIFTSSSEVRSGNTDKVKKVFQLSDKAGKFVVEREKGFNKSKNQFIVKKSVKVSGESKELEKLIVISKLGTLKKSLTVLRPEISEYSVWFEGKKYVSRMEVNPNTKSMEVKLTSPERQWQGKRVFSFPNSTGIFCYFSQITECARATGFIDKAIKRDSGSMKVVIIWEGYPYFQEQYLNIPNAVFTEGTFEYDGKNSRGERRFTLKVGDQAIFYFLDDNRELMKKFWVSQGLSMVELE
ncbi:putative exported protein [Halobacteriovorax marinus SJ]|uniref:Exported protein n=1 Tax=Halobacteriovorax marinus (strain ATCC BAA-682 / DSM 15412 / SJ) TaxID=862908 RepID=E1X0F8_HALMS|nr:hypothetical protein [Halobacteriovorax marinus]CBW27984.1 putative exported protein [Halobacteriovorax marinus SJ]